MLIVIILGILIGFGLSLFPGTMVVLGLFLWLLVYILKAKSFTHDRKFIVKIILCAFALRLLFILCYYHMYLNQGRPDMIGPDGEVYLQRGWYISRILLGQNPYLIPSNDYSFTYHTAIVKAYKEFLPHWSAYQIGIYSYFIGFIFTIFGYNPIMIKLSNALASVLSAVIVYLIGRECFNRQTARAAMCCFIFLPSVFRDSIKRCIYNSPFSFVRMVSSTIKYAA